MSKTISTFIRRLLALIISLTVIPPIGGLLDKSIDPDQLRQTAYYGLMGDRKPATNEAVSSALDKIGGFAKGISNPEWDKPLRPTECKYVDDMAAANVEWVRFGMSGIPLNPDGTETADYKYTKMRIASLKRKGFKIMLNTAQPMDFFEGGVNLFTDEGKQELAKQMAYITKDLQGQIDAVQIGNELSQKRFRSPLSFEQACEFVGISAKAMTETKGNIIVGANCCGPAIYPLIEGLLPYNDYFDYWGIDMYLGCFDSFTKSLEIYNVCIDCIWYLTEKPVMINEFGYISYGKAKTAKEKKELLQQYGYDSEEAAKKDIRGFVAALPKSFQEELDQRMAKTDEDYIDELFNSDLKNHIYKELNNGYYLWGYDHTPDGQAKCIEDSIKLFNKSEHVIGCFAYKYTDSDACYICEQEDCPIETGWGLVKYDGTPKPAYYALQKAYGEIN